MKRALLVMLCLVAQAGSLYGACKSEACKRATAWKNGYTAVILNDDMAATITSRSWPRSRCERASWPSRPSAFCSAGCLAPPPRTSVSCVA
jgi:hypothetical protein